MSSTDYTEITAVLLVGGMGTRLRSIVADIPKCLAPVNEIPFIYYLLNELQEIGVRDAVLCTGYKGDQVESLLGSKFQNIRLKYSHEEKPMGTGGSLRLALPHINHHRWLLSRPSSTENENSCSRSGNNSIFEVSNDDVLVLNGDSYCEADFSAFLSDFRQNEADASILLTKVEDSDRFGTVETDDQGSIINFREKNDKKIQGWVSAGIYLMKKEMIRTIPGGSNISIERQVFPEWVNYKFTGFQSGGFFLDIGTPESFTVAEKYLRSQAIQIQTQLLHT